jgi:general secretion pathway protein G
MNGVASSRRRSGIGAEDGFTLIELLVVLGIIALLMALVAPQVIRYLSEAKSETAAVQVKNLESALELYYLDTGEYPASETGLHALMESPQAATGWHGPYLKHDSGLVDPWGRPYIYRLPGIHGKYDIYSLGRDGAEGGVDENRDVTSW